MSNEWSDDWPYIVSAVLSVANSTHPIASQRGTESAGTANVSPGSYMRSLTQRVLGAGQKLRTRSRTVSGVLMGDSIRGQGVDQHCASRPHAFTSAGAHGIAPASPHISRWSRRSANVHMARQQHQGRHTNGADIHVNRPVRLRERRPLESGVARLASGKGEGPDDRLRISVTVRVMRHSVSRNSDRGSTGRCQLKNLAPGRRKGTTISDSQGRTGRLQRVPTDSNSGDIGTSHEASFHVCARVTRLAGAPADCRAR